MQRSTSASGKASRPWQSAVPPIAFVHHHPLNPHPGSIQDVVNRAAQHGRIGASTLPDWMSVLSPSDCDRRWPGCGVRHRYGLADHMPKRSNSASPQVPQSSPTSLPRISASILAAMWPAPPGPGSRRFIHLCDTGPAGAGSGVDFDKPRSGAVSVMWPPWRGSRGAYADRALCRRPVRQKGNHRLRAASGTPYDRPGD